MAHPWKSLVQPRLRLCPLMRTSVISDLLAAGSYVRAGTGFYRVRSYGVYGNRQVSTAAQILVSYLPFLCYKSKRSSGWMLPGIIFVVHFSKRIGKLGSIWANGMRHILTSLMQWNRRFTKKFPNRADSRDSSILLPISPESPKVKIRALTHRNVRMAMYRLGQDKMRIPACIPP